VQTQAQPNEARPCTVCSEPQDRRPRIERLRRSISQAEPPAPAA